MSRTDDGTTVLVENAIPGELVDVTLRFRKGSVWFAAVSAVHEASPHRTTPPCRYVPECGGCQLQHIDYTEQLQLKLGIVHDALRRQQVSLPGEVAVHSAEPWEYRWRGEFHVVPGAEGVCDAALGFNRARSWRPVAVDDCLIHHPRIRDSLPVLRDLVRRSGDRRLRVVHVTVGEEGAELLVRGKPARALAESTVDAEAARAAVRLSTKATTLQWQGHSYRATPDAFIQVNWRQMDVLYRCVLQSLPTLDGARIVDAYAGIGVLPVHLAAQGADVVCIESNAAAARAGMHNARLNDVSDRMRYVVGAAEALLPSVAGAAGSVILDPPRAGCDGGVTGWLALAGPPRIVYVSCDPATLARDLHVLVASGPYALERLEVVDMFPQTFHVECVATLVRTTEA